MAGGHDMESVIDFVLRKNAGTMTGGFQALAGEDPLEALMREEGGPVSEDDWKIRAEAFWRLLEFFFGEGPEPLAVIRRLYATAKAVAPHLILDMSMEDIALLCGDGGRATVSARLKRVYGDTLGGAGMKAVKAPCQKSTAASEVFRAAQMGNTNRSGSGGKGKDQSERTRRGRGNKRNGATQGDQPNQRKKK